MEALYGRMATSIAQNPSSSGRELALTILQCVTCSSRVLTVAELSQALNKDHSDMLDLQQSIGELCGGFVVVDNSGKVSMLHHSAREYLLDVEDGPFVVNRDAAHEQLFLSCMRCLMSTGIRARITRNEIPDFLEYSATWWSSHLALITTSNESVQTIVSKFLTSHWVLVWIHALVVTKKLRILIRSAKCLSKYATERQKMGVEAFSEVNHMVEHQFLESWAVDFVKIAGRFATNLRRNPEAIYKLIPPFCPHNSAIYQQFGKSEHRSLAVLGLSTQNWDDSIARLSFGIGTNASSILAAGAQIAVLAPPGNVFVYNSSDFEEAATSPIRHGERVYRMAMNGSGSLLVTYGFKSVKVWETSTAACKLSVANLESRPRPLAIIFVKNDSLLLVGSDDRKIRSLDLYDPAPTWHIIAELDEPQLEGHFLNASSYMAINNEGSLIAVAYRGHPLSAWEIDGPIHIDHCWRARGQVARGEVMEAVWHPHSPQLLGLYIEGVVFKWDPYEGNLEEIGTGATTLAISRDGNLFATGDVHGTIKVYTTSEFRLLYQLASQDAVIDLEFSPNIHRLYDVRGDYGTAWEPNALMRYEERLERSLDGDGDSASFGQSSTVSMGASRRVDSVTSLAGSPLGRLYCSGTEYGAVQLFDLQQGKLCDIQDSTLFLGIEQMTWSPNGRCIAFSDSSQNIFIASISPEMAGCEVERLVERSMEDDTSGPITQLLFHPDSSHLLVSTPSTVHLISSESAAVKYHLQGLRDSCKWIIHPQDKSHIVGVGPNSVTICDWNLNQKATYSIQFQSTEDLSSTFEPSPRTGEIDHVRVTQDKRHIFVQMSADNGLKDKMFFHFGTSLISTVPVSVSEGPMNITASVLPKTFGSRISSCLAFLSHDRLVFLSKGHSICWSKISFGTDQDRPSQPSRHLSSISSSSSDASSPWPHHQIFKGGFQQLEDQTNEIFSVPGDWISRDCLALCTIWTSENALLCPRNGEIAVVKSVGLA
jgi:hypothetical protein